MLKTIALGQNLQKDQQKDCKKTTRRLVVSLCTPSPT